MSLGAILLIILILVLVALHSDYDELASGL